MKFRTVACALWLLPFCFYGATSDTFAFDDADSVPYSVEKENLWLEFDNMAEEDGFLFDWSYRFLDDEENLDDFLFDWTYRFLDDEENLDDLLFELAKSRFVRSEDFSPENDLTNDVEEDEPSRRETAVVEKHGLLPDDLEQDILRYKAKIAAQYKRDEELRELRLQREEREYEEQQALALKMARNAHVSTANFGHVYHHDHTTRGAVNRANRIAMGMSAGEAGTLYSHKAKPMPRVIVGRPNPVNARNAIYGYINSQLYENVSGYDRRIPSGGTTHVDSYERYYDRHGYGQIKNYLESYY